MSRSKSGIQHAAVAVMLCCAIWACGRGERGDGRGGETSGPVAMTSAPVTMVKALNGMPAGRVPKPEVPARLRRGSKLPLERARTLCGRFLAYTLKCLSGRPALTKRREAALAEKESLLEKCTMSINTQPAKMRAQMECVAKSGGRCELVNRCLDGDLWRVDRGTVEKALALKDTKPEGLCLPYSKLLAGCLAESRGVYQRNLSDECLKNIRTQSVLRKKVLCVLKNRGKCRQMSRCMRGTQ